MKNYEKYADEIREYKGPNFCKDFVMPHILESEDCGGLACGACYMLQTIWLLEEYEEPEEPEEPKTDWSKVKVDTPILVRTVEGADWVKRNFAKYEGGMVFVWNNGKTSWTALDNECVTPWKYAKLAESEEE